VVVRDRSIEALVGHTTMTFRVAAEIALADRADRLDPAA
jgi:hypothetical protein